MLAIILYVTLLGVSRPQVRIPDETQHILYALYAVETEIEVAQRSRNVTLQGGACPAVIIRMAERYRITEHTFITVLERGLNEDWGELNCVPLPLLEETPRR